MSKSKLSIPKLLIVCGPSGSGKSSLIKRLIQSYPTRFTYSVSHTTRKPRPGEKNGVDYFFVSENDMRKEIEEGKFLEHAKYNRHFYGTSNMSIENVHRSGKVCVLDIDVQGVSQVKKTNNIANMFKAWYVFIKPPTYEVLEQRLRGRLTESEDSINSRLELSKKEIEYGDSAGHFDVVIVNDNFETAYDELKDFVTEFVLHK